MEIKQLQEIPLSSEVMDASQVSLTFIHKDGTQDIGEIKLSGTYTQTSDPYTKTYGRNSFIQAETVLKPDGITPKYQKSSAGTMGWMVIGVDKTNHQLKLKGDVSTLNTAEVLNKTIFSIALDNKSIAEFTKISAVNVETGIISLQDWNTLLDDFDGKTEEYFEELYKTDDNGFFAISDSSLGAIELENFCGCHAEGGSVKAVGKYTHAEGRRTIAGHRYAHAEGDGSFAYGQASHAEGANTRTYGIGAHSEGSETKASGYYSHTEGYGTEASAESAHAEGNKSKAFGGYAHSEGASTQALRVASHAEGSLTIADGHYSHSEGGSTKTYGRASHAEGNSTIAGINIVDNLYSDKKNYAVGDYIYYQVGNDEMSYKCLSENGPATEVHTPEKYTTDAYWKYLGLNANQHAEGFTTRAYGYNSHAGGNDSIADGSSSFAHGHYCKANSDYAVALGQENEARATNSLAVGLRSKVDSNRTYLWSGTTGGKTINRVGSFNVNPENGLSGFYIGDDDFNKCVVKSLKNCENVQLSNGNYVADKGVLSVNTLGASPTGSIAIDGIVCTKDSIAIGCKDGNMNNCAIADASLCCETGKENRGNAFALGYNAKAYNYCATAIGSGKAIGEYAFVAAGGTARGTQSIALGNSESVGSCAASFGNSTKAIGDYSFAANSSTKAIGSNSTAFGNSVSAIGSASFVCGQQNAADGENALAYGYQSHANGQNSVAGIKSSYAIGNNSIALGEDVVISSDNTIGLGFNARSKAEDSKSFIWSGFEDKLYPNTKGKGTFCIYPENGLSGFYICDSTQPYKQQSAINFIDCVIRSIELINTSGTSSQKSRLKAALTQALA